MKLEMLNLQIEEEGKMSDQDFKDQILSVMVDIKRSNEQAIVEVKQSVAEVKQSIAACGSRCS